MTRTLTYLLLGCLVVGSVLGWPTLPERIPGHFGADGQVTRWTDRTALHWFVLPVLALVVALPAIWLARALPRRPHLVNIPDKDRYLALREEHRLPVIERIRNMVFGIAAQVLALLALVQLGIYRTAHGHDTQSYMMAVLVLSLLIVPVTLFLWLPGIQSEINRQWRAQQSGHGPAR